MDFTWQKLMFCLDSRFYLRLHVHVALATSTSAGSSSGHESGENGELKTPQGLGEHVGSDM